MNFKPRKFDADFSDALMSDERKKEGSAESVIKFSGIKKTDAAADFGCGPGFLAFPLAKKCKTVYAIDVNQRMLDAVSAGARRAKLANVEAVKSTEYSVRLQEKPAFLFAISLVHEVVRKRKMFDVFSNLLKDKGRLVIVDWRTDPKSFDFGPSARERISKAEMIELAAGLFKLKKEKVMENQYYLLFEKA